MLPIFTTPIENIVVLMMENHSFHNMLGWLQGIGQLKGNESNQYLGHTYTTHDAGRPAYQTIPGPMHGFCNVNMQLFGTYDPPPGAIPTMGGFVQDYETMNTKQPCPGAGASGLGANVMACYSPDQLPVISLLAQTFGVCRRWFCSVPGPTGPNRIYANCASSGGYAGGSYEAKLAGPCGGHWMPCEMRGLHSIFGVLANAGLTWGIYHEDPIKGGPHFSPELILDEVNAKPGWALRDPGFSLFYDAIQRGKLPHYSFLTPDLWQNSQHPYDDIRFGECVMANIYEMIANSSYWEKTLFIITYDEHGGFYDSVPPPIGVPNPDGRNWMPAADLDGSQPPWFFFDRLGVRVPAILISPYIQAQVDDTPYEHSSIPATVIKLFGLDWPDLPPPAPPNQRNQRIETVNTFEGAIGTTLRTDVPMTLPRPAAGGSYVPLPPPMLPIK